MTLNPDTFLKFTTNFVLAGNQCSPYGFLEVRWGFYMHIFFRLKPRLGQFPIEEIKVYLARLPHVANDPNHRETYLFDSSEKEVKELVETLRANPGAEYPRIGIVDISGDEINVTQETIPEIIREIAGFVAWLVEQVPCTTEDEEGARVEASSSQEFLVKLFGPFSSH